MLSDWTNTAQRHWIEQLEYCAKTFGETAASEFIKNTDEKIERICKFPESGTREPLLKEKDKVFRYVLINKRIKLIYRFDEELQTVYIEDVWNIKMDPEHLLDRMK